MRHEALPFAAVRVVVVFLAAWWCLTPVVAAQQQGMVTDAVSPDPDLSGVGFRFVETNGIRMHIAEAGAGPLVVLVHGFPESWYSWRHQIPALARAGYRVVAPDMRGYGRTDRPSEVERYNALELAGDLVGLVAALGEDEAVLVGHDWGSSIAAVASLLRPDVFRATVLLSVPFLPQVYDDIPPTESLAAALPEEMSFYMLHFQQPEATAELEHDARRFLLALLYSASGSATPEEQWRPYFRSDGGFFSSVSTPSELPEWLREEDLDVYARQFEESGFDGPLNWYRNIDRNWRLRGFHRGARLMQPTLFVAGTVDPGLTLFREQYEDLEKNVPNLTRKVLLPGKGHWIQQEAPEDVSRLILEFLAAVPVEGERE